METGTIFLILGLLILVGLFISRPFFIHKKVILSQEEQQRSILLAEKERLITTIKELDLDYSLNKIAADNYPSLRVDLINKAAAVLNQLDMLQTNPDEVNKQHPGSGKHLKKKSQKTQSTTKSPHKRRVIANSSGDDELEAMIASRRRERSEKAVGFCHQCGKPIQLSDRFCPRCGATLNVDE